MNIVVPMAGEGKRFKEAGYTEPKPFIDINGKPMIERVLDTLPEGKRIFLVREEHMDRMDQYGGVKIPVTETTEGAAATVLLAKNYIDNQEPLLIVNSDQIVKYNIDNFNQLTNNYDGIIFVFRAHETKWSYVSLDDFGLIGQVAEKEPISDLATAGLYYWGAGSDFVWYADIMIKWGEKTLGEYYVAPVYNGAIKDGSQISPYFVDEMHGLGTPEDVEKYLAR